VILGTITAVLQATLMAMIVLSCKSLARPEGGRGVLTLSLVRLTSEKPDGTSIFDFL